LLDGLTLEVGGGANDADDDADEDWDPDAAPELVATGQEEEKKQ